MKIIIGVSRNCKIGSRAIRWWIGADYSHAYVRWTLRTQGRDVIYQASHGMVHFRSLENFEKENQIVEEVEIDLTDDQFKRFSVKCIDLAGVEYSTIELVQIFLCDISNGKMKFEDQPGYICSELICDLLEDLAVKFSKPKYMMNPKDIMLAVKEHNSSLAQLSSSPDGSSCNHNP